jgi:hypothetical protein
VRRDACVYYEGHHCNFAGMKRKGNLECKIVAESDQSVWCRFAGYGPCLAAAISLKKAKVWMRQWSYFLY